MKLEHCGIVVSDLDQSRKFYCDFLGMTEVERPGSFKFDGAWFRSEETDIHAIMSKDTTASAGLPDQGLGKTGGLVLHFAFKVENYSEMYQRALNLPDDVVKVVSESLQRGDGIHQFYVEDPDGHVVELFQRLADSGERAEPRVPVQG